MPLAVIVIVGGPLGAGDGVVGVVGVVVPGGMVLTGGVGAVGVDDVEPPEQAVTNIRTINKQAARGTVFFECGTSAGGATDGLSVYRKCVTRKHRNTEAQNLKT
jgi:hypothetical protein